MASNGQGLKIAIQLLLGIVIIVLGYVLYRSITGPWEVVEQREEMTRMTRERMDKVRIALIRYERNLDRYPSVLDSLSLWLKTDSFMVANRDSLFGIGFDPDSMYYSPRTRKAFLYAVNDTGRVVIYLLRDPDSEDQIGSEIPDITRLNAASWE